ncbi:BON domain-containing protein [Nodosilinea nodulosa]|uniref:BON domain-containing protein n=1 Tax=Nodosilinea nodulosa TaxID=416001 RepID=UPI0002F9FF2B|nr:BON domain-containing protein [Nodosilinea nodulosa]
MKKVITLVLGSLLLLGATAYSTSADSANADGDRGSNSSQDGGAGNSLANDGQQTPGNLASEVSETLATNLPGSRLTVQVIEGVATISGNVRSQEQFDKIESLAMDVKGINSVSITAEIGPG